jgi:endogenous inhibitor of DNA gyrase (YacG/DUF329 family)
MPEERKCKNCGITVEQWNNFHGEIFEEFCSNGCKAGYYERKATEERMQNNEPLPFPSDIEKTQL